MKKSNLTGLLYFIIHFLVEITSFYVLTCYIKSPYVWGLSLLYDFAAFVPQGFFGWLRDKGLRVNFAFWGTVLTTLSLVLLNFNVNAFITVIAVSLGNCLVHIHGAELTLRSSAGKIAPSAVFVSGGSFGVVTGKLLSSHGVAVPWILGLNLLTFVPILLAERLKTDNEEENLDSYHFSNEKLNAVTVIALATFVVAVRAYMGYGIPTSWNKTELQTVALYCSMGVGKGLGGILTDKIGIRLTALISTVGALPFMIFGSDVMEVSLIGIASFSMTMAVTLALIVSRLPRHPGVAFGFTTVGLFLGTLPFFFFRIQSVLTNSIIITALTVPCVIILWLICAKKPSAAVNRNHIEPQAQKGDQP
ncbi:MAG: hypothetical protein IJH07_04015 [Ruminococcus sp.]|nr:hypothetical protein [Ruminococcus sp.]